jgi:FkbM family methyltransferase
LFTKIPPFLRNFLRKNHLTLTFFIYRFLKYSVIHYPVLAPSLKKICDDVIYKRNSLGLNVFFGLNNIDEKLLKYLNYENGYFIELGANDGVTQSNTLFLEKNKNWKGILVEPMPANFLLCKKNRSLNNHFFCNACVSFDYSDKFVEMIYSNLMTTTLEIESDISNVIEHTSSGSSFLEAEEDVFSFAAIATNLNNILVKSKAPALIDFMSLDVEGVEIEVLKGINHDEFRFKYILIESRNFSKLQSYMNSIGYFILDNLSEHDYLFSGDNIIKS